MKESTEVVKPFNYAEMLANMAKESTEAEKPESNFISFKSGLLSFNGNAAPGNKVKVIIISAAFENVWFPNEYDPDNLVSPDCWAIGHVEDDLAPTDESTEPQSTKCDGCDRNLWKESAKGKNYKECDNVRRLAMILESDLDNPAAASIMYAKLSVLNVKHWAKYVNQIGNVVKRPSWAVVTELSVTPDPRSQFKVGYQFMGLVADDKLDALHELYNRVRTEMLFGYPKNRVKSDEEVTDVSVAPKGKGKGKY